MARRRRRRAQMGSWGSHVRREAYSGAGCCGRRVGEDSVEGGECYSSGAARLLRGTPANSEESGSLLHTNKKGIGLEVRRDTRKRTEGSRGWEVDGVDRKQGNSAADVASPASDWGGLGAWCSWESMGNGSYGEGVDIGGSGEAFLRLNARIEEE